MQFLSGNRRVSQFFGRLFFSLVGVIDGAVREPVGPVFQLHLICDRSLV